VLALHPGFTDPRAKAALIPGVKQEFLPHQTLVLSCFPGRKAAWEQ